MERHPDQRRLLREFLYELSFPSTPAVLWIDGYDLPLHLPSAPPDSLCQNFALPIEEQKFRRDPFPRDWKYWDKRDKDAYAAQMYHLRRNGEWWFIKGRKLYIPGPAWVFFNYWHTAGGGIAEFRLSALELFWVWYLSVAPDKNCMGLFDIKPRRIGDTENFLFIGWERTTAYRSVDMGMMANDDKKAKKNFKRIVNAHRKMPPPFRAINKGTDKAENVLEFTYPPELFTKKKLENGKEIKPEFPSLESKIDYSASVVGSYDGERLFYFLFDETGKITKYNFAEQMDVIRPTMTLFNDQVIVGKAALPTTVEDYKMGKIVEWITDYWNGSDPNMRRDEYGRTLTGMYRILRTARISAEVDEWGFPDEYAEEKILGQRKYLEDQKQFRKLERYKRQFPLFIEDALAMPATECPLLPHLLDAQIKNILLGKDWKGNDVEKRTTRGNLIWTNGQLSDVKFVPDENGRWVIAQHPERPNARFMENGVIKPGNKALYKAGLDPLDEGGKNVNATTRESQLSKMAIVIKRRFDPFIDNERSGVIKAIDEETGVEYITNPEVLKTGRVVCFYKHRPETPFEGFMDSVKTMIYYGVPVFLETNRIYYRNLYLEYGLGSFLVLKSAHLMPTIKRSGVPELGSKSTPLIKNLYVDSLINHISQFWMNCDILELLQDARKFNGQNAPDCDGTVAWGFVELQEYEKKKMQEDESVDGWRNAPWQTYTRNASTAKRSLQK